MVACTKEDNYQLNFLEMGDTSCSPNLDDAGNFVQKWETTHWTPLVACTKEDNYQFNFLEMGNEGNFVQEDTRPLKSSMETGGETHHHLGSDYHELCKYKEEESDWFMSKLETYRQIQFMVEIKSFFEM